jgi:hypothetical protein
MCFMKMASAFCAAASARRAESSHRLAAASARAAAVSALDAAASARSAAARALDESRMQPVPTVDINMTAAAIPATLIFPFRIVSPPLIHALQRCSHARRLTQITNGRKPMSRRFMRYFTSVSAQ